MDSAATPVRVPGCRRDHPRRAVTLAGSALGLGRSRSVIVSDVGAGGAQLNGHDLPPPGDDVFVVVGPCDSMGVIAWRCGERAGVRFDEPIGEEMLARLEQEASWMSIAGWYR